MKHKPHYAGLWERFLALLADRAAGLVGARCLEPRLPLLKDPQNDLRQLCTNSGTTPLLESLVQMAQDLYHPILKL